MKRHNGFTLTELVITLAVGSILLNLAVPSFSAMIQNNRMTTQLNEFVSTLHIARSEAVKRNRTVIVCATDDLQADPLDCTAGADWESGWLIFADGDGDGAPAADADECVAGQDCLLAVYAGVDPGSTLRGEAGISDAIAYLPYGGSDDAGTFTLCDTRGAEYAKAVVVSMTGRPRASDAKADGSALTCP